MINLSAFVNERLSAAAVEIFGEIEKTIALYQGEVSRSRHEIERLREELHLLKEKSALDSPQDNGAVNDDKWTFTLQLNPGPVPPTDNRDTSSPIPGYAVEGPTQTGVIVKCIDWVCRSAQTGVKSEIKSEEQEFCDAIGEVETDIPPALGSLQDNGAVSDHKWTFPLQQSAGPAPPTENRDTSGPVPGDRVPRTSQADVIVKGNDQGCCFIEKDLGSTVKAEERGCDIVGAEVDTYIPPVTVRRDRDQPDKEFALGSPLDVLSSSGDGSEEDITDNDEDWEVNKTTEEDSRRWKSEKQLCHLCSKEFQYEACLLKHIENHKNFVKYNTCKICHKAFSSPEKLRAHLQTVHSTYFCDICGKSFSQTNLLVKHMMVHSKEKLYKCPLCCVSFSRKARLEAHSKTHTAESSYSCDVCGKAFSLHRSLNAHMKTHTK